MFTRYSWMRAHSPPLSVRLVTWLLLMLFAEASVAPSLSPKGELFWQMERAIAQGEINTARKQASAAPNLAKALWQEILFDRLKNRLDEEPAPLSPLRDKVGELLSEAVPDEGLKRLWDLTGQVQPPQNPFSSEAKGLEGVLARFVAAHFVPSRSLWQDVIKQCDGMGLELGTAFSLHELARWEREEGNFDIALRLLGQARPLLERFNHQRRLARLLNDLGTTASRLGIFEQARQNLQSALALEKAANNPIGQARVLNNLGILASQTGAYREAVRNFQQALELIKPLSDKRRQIIYLNNLGSVYKEMSDYEAALRTFQQVLALLPMDGAPLYKASVWNNMGDTYRLLGDFNQALYCLKQASEAAKAVGDKGLQGLVLHTLGVVYREKGDTEQALEYLQEALKLRRSLNLPVEQVETLIAIGATLKDLKKFAQGRRFLEEALSLAQQIDYKTGEALALLNIGAIDDDEGLYEQAIANFEKALSFWESIGDELGMAWCFLNIGKSQEELGKRGLGAERERRWAEALDAYRKAVNLVETIRQKAGHERLRAEFTQTVAEPFYRLVNFLAQMGRGEEAFEVTEQARAQALLNALRWQSGLEEEPRTEEERSQYSQLQRRIASLEEQVIAELTKSQPDAARLQELQQGLEKARAELERLKDTWRLRRLLLAPERKSNPSSFPPDLAVLAYIVTQERTWLFVLYEDKEKRAKGIGQRVKGEICLELYPIEVTQEELQEDVLWLRENILRQRPIGVTAQRLFSYLLAPALKAIAGKRWLCIIPDGALYALPFQALQDEAGHYLIERHAVFYAPSLRLLEELQRRCLSHVPRPPSRFFTGLGNPKRDALYPSLPYATQEVQAIARLLASSRQTSIVPRYFLAEKATEEAAWKALRESRWVHFATHAILEPRRPLYSRLVLVPDKTHDGFLRAHEVLDAEQIAAEMVVLSACETGRGRILRGEGTVGLAWSFLASGVQTLVVSQWQVNDMSTARLMTAFYRNLLKKLPPSEALRQAQLDMAHTPPFTHPFHWAAFLVMGLGR